MSLMKVILDVLNVDDLAKVEVDIVVKVGMDVDVGVDVDVVAFLNDNVDAIL